MSRAYRYIIVFLGLFFSFSASAQKQLTDSLFLSFSKAEIRDYLEFIEKELDVSFVYSDHINPTKEISLEPGRYTAQQILDSVLKDQNIDLILKANTIILSSDKGQIPDKTEREIEGRVVDHRGRGIPFATIFIENKGIGTITNADGYFRIIIPLKYHKDTLTVGSLGYKYRRILPDGYTVKNNIISLEDAHYSIQRVTVRPEKAEYLVAASYKKVKDNYQLSNSAMKAFFREWSKQDADYISISEALIDIYKTSYMSEANDHIRFVRGRNGSNVEDSELVNLVVEGGLYNGLRLDIVKNSSYFYSEEALNECTYKKKKTIILNGKQTYVIAFTPKEHIDYPGYQGKLFIDVESLALVRAEFELSSEGIYAARSLLVKKTPRNYKAKPVYAKYTVDYRLYNGKWSLYAASSDFGIRVKKVRGKENKGFSCDFTSRSEFVVTDYDLEDVHKIPANQTVKSRDVLYEQISVTNKNFWQNENIILPEEPLHSAIYKLQEQDKDPEQEDIMSKEK